MISCLKIMFLPRCSEHMSIINYLTVRYFPADIISPFYRGGTLWPNVCFLNVTRTFSNDLSFSIGFPSKLTHLCPTGIFLLPLNARWSLLWRWTTMTRMLRTVIMSAQTQNRGHSAKVIKFTKHLRMLEVCYKAYKLYKYLVQTLLHQNSLVCPALWCISYSKTLTCCLSLRSAASGNSLPILASYVNKSMTNFLWYSLSRNGLPP